VSSLTERTSGVRRLGRRGRLRLRRTRDAIGLVLGRADALAITTLVAASYLAGYLWLTNRLSVRGDLGVGLTVVEEPLGRVLERTEQLQFEPIALVDLWYVRLLISPIDGPVGLVLAVLVGLNLAIAYLALVQPKACGMSAGAGSAAAVPALLSGSACCAPVIVIALGVQIGATALTVLPWLLPLGALLLVGSLLYVSGLVGVEN
jgi:hypothetical protein